MKSVFISDLHLSADNLDIYEAFRHFLHGLEDDVQALFILGDLFEAWIGDDDPSDFSASVKNCLYQVSRRGISLKVQHGNRDFLLGKKFAEDTGAEIIGDYYLFEQYGQKALLMHGDLLCTDDEAYQRFRKKVHGPVYNFILRNLPLFQRQRIANKWRAQSKEMNRNKAENIMDVNANAVQQTLSEYNADTLIHGHTHRPKTHRLKNERIRIVLGDWGENCWWIEASKTGFELKSKNLQELSNG